MRAELVVEFGEGSGCCGIDMTDNDRDRVSFAVIYSPRSPAGDQESPFPLLELRIWLSET